MWLGPKSASEPKRKKKNEEVLVAALTLDQRLLRKLVSPQLHPSEEGFKETSRICSPWRQKHPPPGTVGPN